MTDKTFFENLDAMKRAALSRDHYMLEVVELNHTLFLGLRENLGFIQDEAQWKMWLSKLEELLPKYHQELLAETLPESLEARKKSASTFLGKKSTKNSRLKGKLRLILD